MKNQQKPEYIIHPEEKEHGGYPAYPDEEDIYSSSTELEDIDPEEIYRNKRRLEEFGPLNTKGFDDLKTGDDLDVPGTDPNNPEEIGEEDEENGYFSLGEDNYD